MGERELRRQRLRAKQVRSRNRKLMAVGIVLIFIVGFAVVYSLSGGGGNVPVASGGRVLIVTSMGNFTIELYDDMPITSGNFKNLVQQGAYDDTIFHRVVAGFVVQGGDVSGKGINVPSIQDELPNKHSNVRGTLSMAKSVDSNTGAIAPNSATSQFFVNLVDNSNNLDSDFSVFGHVISGMSVVDEIAKVEVIDEKPKIDVVLIKAV